MLDFMHAREQRQLEIVNQKLIVSGGKSKKLAEIATVAQQLHTKHTIPYAQHLQQLGCQRTAVTPGDMPSAFLGESRNFHLEPGPLPLQRPPAVMGRMGSQRMGSTRSDNGWLLAGSEDDGMESAQIQEEPSDWFDRLLGAVESKDMIETLVFSEVCAAAVDALERDAATPAADRSSAGYKRAALTAQRRALWHR